MRSVFLLFAFFVFFSSINSAIAQRTPLFREFPTGGVYVGPHSEPDLSSRDAYSYRTRLREAAREDVNFAGHYRVVKWGCGTGCISGAVVDVISGRVTFFPFSICCSVKIGEADFEPVLVRPNSRLIVFVGMRGEEPPDAAHFYEFTGRDFVYLASSKPFPQPPAEAIPEVRSVPVQEAVPYYRPDIPAVPRQPRSAAIAPAPAPPAPPEAKPVDYAAADSTPAPTPNSDASPRPTKRSNDSADGESILIIAAAVLAVTYFLPTTIAFFRGHLSTFSIFLVNLVLGWTFIGWFVALVWSFSGNTRDNERRIARAIVAESKRQSLASK